MKDEFGGKKLIVALTAKSFSYLTDNNNNKDKKVKGTWKCVVKKP